MIQNSCKCIPSNFRIKYFSPLYSSEPTGKMLYSKICSYFGMVFRHYCEMINCRSKTFTITHSKYSFNWTGQWNISMWFFKINLSRIPVMYMMHIILYLGIFCLFFEFIQSVVITISFVGIESNLYLSSRRDQKQNHLHLLI